MKTIKIILVILLSSITGSLLAQESVQESRELILKISNKRGKPVSGVVVQSVNGGDVGITDANGKYVFHEVLDPEHIRMYLPKRGEVIVPVEGVDSMLVVLRSGAHVDFFNERGKELIDLGYGTTTRNNNTSPVSQLDAEKMVAQTGARNLFDLLRGKVAGLDIKSDGSATIRGTSSILMSSEPLVVLDGVIIGTLAEANNIVNVNDVKSVSVLKQASIYGSRGANGVILINTKK